MAVKKSAYLRKTTVTRLLYACKYIDCWQVEVLLLFPVHHYTGLRKTPPLHQPNHIIVISHYTFVYLLIYFTYVFILIHWTFSVKNKKYNIWKKKQVNFVRGNPHHSGLQDSLFRDGGQGTPWGAELLFETFGSWVTYVPHHFGILWKSWAERPAL